jgi:hypothetical protein
MLQANKSRFNQYNVDPSFLLCAFPLENREHALISCKAFAQEREDALIRILPYMKIINLTDTQWTQLFIDCSKAAQENIIEEDAMDDIYYHTCTVVCSWQTQ